MGNAIPLISSLRLYSVGHTWKACSPAGIQRATICCKTGIVFYKGMRVRTQLEDCSKLIVLFVGFMNGISHSLYSPGTCRSPTPTHPRGSAFTHMAFSIPHTDAHSSRPVVSGDSSGVCWRRGALQFKAGQARSRAAQIDWASWNSLHPAPKLSLRDGRLHSYGDFF